MSSRTRSRAGVLARIGVALGALLIAGQSSAHPLGMYIFRDENDKLVMVFPWGMYWPIKYRVPPFQGWMDYDYPFEEALFDRPAQNLFKTHVGAKIEVVLVQMTPGFWVRDPADINQPYHNAGERFSIGTTGEGFLTFPWWHLDEADPNWVPNLESYSASFYLRDITGIHGDSDVYTFNVYPDEGFCAADFTTTAVPTLPGYGVPDGILNSEDFFFYVAQFAANSFVYADLTSTAVAGTPGYGIPDGLINNDDFFYYLGLYALGC